MRFARGAARRLRRPPAGAEPAETSRLLVVVTDLPAETAADLGAGWTRASPADLAVEDAGVRWDEVAVHAGSLAELRLALPALAGAGRTRRLRIMLAATHRARAVASPVVVARRAVNDVRLQHPDGPGGRLSVRLRLPKAAPVIDCVAAAVAPRRGGGRPHPAGGLRLGLTDVAALPWAAGDPTARMLSPGTPLQDAEHQPLYDLLVGPEIRPDPAAGPPRLPGTATGDVEGGDRWLPPVDTVTCSPWGFRPAGPHAGTLTSGADGVQVRVEGERPVRFGAAGLTENDLHRLRELRLVHLAAGLGPDDPATGHLLAQLCCAGVPVAAPGLPDGPAAELGRELAARLTTLDPGDLTDPIARESWSIGTRRLALARFGPRAAWACTAAPLGLPVAPAPTLSIVLPTRRPALLPFALAQIARQDLPDVQTIVILHGGSREDPSIGPTLAGFAGLLEVVEVDAEVPFGQALNAGLNRCSGQLVTKMDDDDWYGPHHLTDLVQAHQHSGATLVGAGGYHVYLAEADVTVRYTHVPTEAFTNWVHGGTTLLAAEDLRTLGGWRALRVGEDAAMLAAVQAAGGSIYGIHDLGFTYYRGRGHTWTPRHGDERWLVEGLPRSPGFAPPPQLDPLPHPWLSPDPA